MSARSDKTARRNEIRETGLGMQCSHRLGGEVRSKALLEDFQTRNAGDWQWMWPGRLL